MLTLDNSDGYSFAFFAKRHSELRKAVKKTRIMHVASAFVKDIGTLKDFLTLEFDFSVMLPQSELILLNTNFRPHFNSIFAEQSVWPKYERS